MAELHAESVLGLSRLLGERRASAEELTRAYLDRCAAVDGELGAYLRLDPEGALAAARESDRRRSAGEARGPLDGVPLALKDNLVSEGLETTAGSRILAGWRPPYDASVVARLRGAGAVLLGKLNLDEFAMGSSTESSAYRLCRNPWDLARVPGGSSGGAAAAVAAELCAAALGTDTGGSIRQPASLCGVCGLKPSYGRVSRYGLIAFASSLDQVGPIARTTADCALLLEAIAGHDPRDATSLEAPVAPYLEACARGRAKGPRGLRVGVPREYFVAGMDPEVEAAVRGAIAALAAEGAELVELSLPHTRYAVAAYYLICTAEASSNLARYDGTRYGLRVAASSSGSGELEAMSAASRGRGFGPEVKRRIMLGTFALSAGYYDAYYARAQRARTLIRRDFEAAFARCDVIATPTSPVPAFRIGEKMDDPLQMYLADIFTISCNLAGLPGISLPCGFTAAGLPVGLQLLAPPLGEEALLAAAGAYEALSPAAGRRPPLARGARS
jgi:aspartyl-tRNA(Asn)/glutamyl-tRNA(Gln) amidotransferase subunit A